MSESVFSSVADFAAARQNAVLRLLGGEVVSEGLELLPYLNYARRRGANLVLCTNGFHLTPWTSGAIDPRDFTEIIVSCYGPRQAHETVTRIRGSFKRTYHTIEWLSSWQGRSYELTVNTILTGYNAKYFLDFVTGLVHLGVDEIKVLFLSPLGHAARPSDHSQPYLRVAENIRELVRSSLVSAFGGSQARRTRIIWEPTSPTLAHSLIPSCKLAQSTMVTVDWKGFVYPCHLLIGQQEFAIARITGSNQSLQDLLAVYESAGGDSSLLDEDEIIKRGCPAFWGGAQRTNELPPGTKSLCPLYLQRLV